jgi:hypothetical protein
MVGSTGTDEPARSIAARLFLPGARRGTGGDRAHGARHHDPAARPEVRPDDVRAPRDSHPRRVSGTLRQCRVEVDADAVRVAEQRVALTPERVPRLLLSLEARRDDARVDLVELGWAAALERE